MSTVEGKIQELERLRTQTRWWRIGLTVGATAIVLICVATIVNAVQGLTQPGPRQQEFATALGDGVKRDVVPNLQSIASQSFTEIRPEVEKELSKVNDRVPELTQASMKELQTLQQEVPEKSEKIIREEFTTLLKKKEPTLKQMFPDVTEDKVNALVQNLADSGEKHIVLANDSLFSGHMTAMNAIVADMEKIRTEEKPNVQNEQANWEMGLALLDLVRDDLKDFEPKKGTATSGAPAKMKTLPNERKAAAVTPTSVQEARR